LVPAGLATTRPASTLGRKAIAATAEPVFASLPPRELSLFDSTVCLPWAKAMTPPRLKASDSAKRISQTTGHFEFSKIGYDDKIWRRLRLPHDWAVE